MSDAERIDFRVTVYTSRGSIELERRHDGITLFSHNGVPVDGARVFTLEELAALHRAIELAEGGTP
jgi:hypothetical protein